LGQNLRLGCGVKVNDIRYIISDKSLGLYGESLKSHVWIWVFFSKILYKVVIKIVTSLAYVRDVNNVLICYLGCFL
jgi:hypothetical protein